jgi:hypothetical protein
MKWKGRLRKRIERRQVVAREKMYQSLQQISEDLLLLRAADADEE